MSNGRRHRRGVRRGRLEQLYTDALDQPATFVRVLAACTPARPACRRSCMTSTVQRPRERIGPKNGSAV
jgi:hypothetical protein